MRKIGLAVLIAAILALLYLAWSQHSARLEAERELGLDAARMVNARFGKAAEVKVGTLSGKVTARARHDGLIFDSEQTTTIPASVDYFIDLARIDKSSYRWDEGAKTLTIDIPDVTPGKPNMDEAAATASQKGVFISRKAALALARQGSARAAARASATAREPKNLNQARASARELIARLAREPLAATGMTDVKVAVSFPWEPKSGEALDERWDESRPIEEVLAERRAQGR